MKFIRFSREGSVAYGVLDGNRVHTIQGDIFHTYAITNTDCAVQEVKILSPCMPSKIIAVGLNYRSHAKEMSMPIPDEPLIFMKPATAVIGHEDHILYPDMSRRVDYEGELGVIIGKTCRHVSHEHAIDYILGYTCCNDVTARDLQKKDGQFTRSKSFDTFAPIGPCIETDINPDDICVETFLNGTRRQQGSTGDFIFPVHYLVSFISQVMTLCPGDVISTGTPSGIGPMQPGDSVEVRIDGIGILRNIIVSATPT